MNKKKRKLRKLRATLARFEAEHAAYVKILQVIIDNPGQDWRWIGGKPPDVLR